MAAGGAEIAGASQTSPAVVRFLLAGLWAFWRRGRRVERVAYAVGTALFASGLFHLGVYAVDGGPWQGPLSWRKPVTFGLSFGLTLVTAAWAMSFLRLGAWTRTWLLGVFTVACVIEVFGISLQRWRGEESHFNEETAFNTVLSRGGLAGGALVLVAFVIVVTVLNLRPAPYLPASMRLALRSGWLLLLGAMAVGVAMVMTAVIELNTPGVPEPVQQQAAYSSAGWLKPAHAITMHAILLLPGLAWLASHTTWDEARRLRVMVLATGSYWLLAVVVVGETLAGAGLLRAPMWADALVAAGLLGFAAAGVLVLTALPRAPSGMFARDNPRNLRLQTLRPDPPPPRPEVPSG
jgi:hypothetical protein